MERRRRFSDEEKARIVEERLAPGNSVAATARRYGIFASYRAGLTAGSTVNMANASFGTE